MTFAEQISQLTLLDAAGVGTLLAAWIGLGWLVEHEEARRPSVTALMSAYRRAWMREMVGRDPRIFDAQILGGLRQSTAFFASTVVLVIGGALALAGNTDPLEMAAEDAGFIVPHVVWQTKLILVVYLLTNAFLRFVWSNRLFGYCAVVMAAVPNDPTDPTAHPRAQQAAEINIRAAVSFNRGLRSVYFAFAAAAWLIGPVALLIATAAAIWVIWRREFASLPQQILKEDLPS